MYVWGRLLKVALTLKSRGPYLPGGESRLAFRCLPTDIDPNVHLNNARYLMLADLGRMDIFLRSGLLQLTRRNNWAPMMGGVQSVFVREIRLWKRFEVISSLETWDGTQVIGHHRFVLDGETAALVMTTAGIYDRTNRKFLEIDDVIAALGVTTARQRPPSEAERIFMQSHSGLRMLAKGG